MDSPPFAYLPVNEAEPPQPLARFLPPLPAGSAPEHLRRLLPDAGGWVLDPFGASPLSVLDMARAGRRVLVSVVNPLLAFQLETLAAAPRPAEFQSGMAVLATAKRGEERLETHIRGLYRTPCAGCGEEVEAEAFLWRRGETAPYARVYRCPRCRDEGERPLHPLDHERLAPPGSDALHRSRALARVANREDEYYPAVEEALAAYQPRPLYALQTLINKAEGPGFSSAQRRLLQALLLSCCDAASTLWPLGGGKQRPRQLVTPAQFRENNLWLALEQAAAQWSAQPGAVPLVRVDDPGGLAAAAASLPESGGVLLFAGRIRALTALPESLRIQAVLAVFPRPNQAFWTLSALWAGWLWGREAALPLHPLLGRRRYDWNWHAGALHSPLSALARLVPAGIPLLGLLPELVPGFLAAVLAAGVSSGWHPEGLALRADEEQAQVLWNSRFPSTGPVHSAAGLAREAEKIFAEGVRQYLSERGEPSDYLPVYAAGLEALAGRGGLPGPLPERAQLPGDLLTRVQTLTGRVFSDRGLLRRFETGSQEDERSLWWLAAEDSPAQLPLEVSRPALPLADRVEMDLVRLLQKSPGMARYDLDAALCRLAPGLLTPSAELVNTLLDSYAEEQNGGWRLQPAEMPAARRADLEEARGMLRALGLRLGYRVEGETPLVWTPVEYGQVYYFYVIASSVVSRYVLPGLPAPAGQVVMVFPGGRARLLAFKLRRDPRLREALKGVHLLKFRHLRALHERPGLTPDQWEGLLDADPPFFEEAEQMRLL